LVILQQPGLFADAIAVATVSVGYFKINHNILHPWIMKKCAVAIVNRQDHFFKRFTGEDPYYIFKLHYYPF